MRGATSDRFGAGKMFDIIIYHLRESCGRGEAELGGTTFQGDWYGGVVHVESTTGVGLQQEKGEGLETLPQTAGKTVQSSTGRPSRGGNRETLLDPFQ